MNDMMGTSSRNIIDVFIKLVQSLECPVCYEYVATPIWQCEAGHIICNQCKSSIHNCPTCRCSFSSVRVRSLEQISDLMLFPCKNDGCEKILPLTDIKYHENVCSLANASSRPDKFARSTILQYNILKYIEQDIAPFFITGHQSHERGTQTDTEIRSMIVKDDSTMTNSNSGPELQSIDSSNKIGNIGLKIVKPSNANFETYSIRGANQSSSSSDVLTSPFATLSKKASNAAVKNISTLPPNNNFKFVPSQDKVLKEIRPSSMTSKKLSSFFNETERKLAYRKGSTKYDCFLQSTSSKSKEICKTTKSVFDISPSINKSPTYSTSHSLVSDVGYCTSEPKFNFFSNAPALRNRNNISESVQGPASLQPPGNDSVFYFKTQNSQSSKSNEPKGLIQKHYKKKYFGRNEHKHGCNFRSEPFNKESSGFDFSAFLKANPGFGSDENRVEVTEKSVLPCTNAITVSSCNVTNTNVVQSVNAPVFSSITFSDITFENFKGSVESVSGEVASAFNYEKQCNNNPLPAKTPADLSSSRMNRPSEDIGSQPSTSKIPSAVPSNDLWSGMPFSISRNTDPLDSLSTNSTFLLNSCSSSVPTGECNSSALRDVNSTSNNFFGSKNNVGGPHLIDISKSTGFPELPLKTALDHQLGSDSNCPQSKTKISASPIFSSSDNRVSIAGIEGTSTTNVRLSDSESLQTSFHSQSLTNEGPCQTLDRNNCEVPSNDSGSVRNVFLLPKNNSSQFNTNFSINVFNQAADLATAPVPLVRSSSGELKFLFPSNISHTCAVTKEANAHLDNTKPLFSSSFNFGKISNVIQKIGDTNSAECISAQSIVNVENNGKPVSLPVSTKFSFTFPNIVDNCNDSLGLGLSGSSSETDKHNNCPLPVKSVKDNIREVNNFSSQNERNSAESFTSQTFSGSDKRGDSNSNSLSTNSGEMFPVGVSSIAHKNCFAYSTPSAIGAKSSVPLPLSNTLFSGKSNESFPCFFKTLPATTSATNMFCPLIRKTSSESANSLDSTVNSFSSMKTDSNTLKNSPCTTFNFASNSSDYGSKGTESSTSASNPLFSSLKSQSLSHNTLFGRDNNTLWNSNFFDSTSKGNSKTSGFPNDFFSHNGPKNK